MKALLIGCGAVGLGLAAALYDGGAQTDLLARGRTLESLRKNGVKREGIFKEVRIPPEKVNAYGALSEIPVLGYDYILVCSKTTGNAEIAAQLASRRNELLAPEGCLVICQNGFGNEEAFFGCAERGRIYSASFAIGFARPEPYCSRVTVFSSPVNIGSLYGGALGRLAPLTESLESGGIPCRVNDRIEQTLWAKMLYNCTLNPLSAILRCDYGGLMRAPETVAVMDAVIGEIFDVMRACGYTTFWPDAAAYRKEFYEKILPPTYRHRSSTLQDMERGIKTEIGSLSGVIVRLGQVHGVPVPVNTMLYRLVRSLESLCDDHR